MLQAHLVYDKDLYSLSDPFSVGLRCVRWSGERIPSDEDPQCDAPISWT